MMVKAESAQEQGLSAGNREIMEEHADRVEAMERRGNKDSRAGIKNYCNKSRFFLQLEAVHGPAPAGTASAVAPPATAVGVPGMVGPSTVRALAAPPLVGATAGMATPVVGATEKRAQDRMAREEAWRRQELARLAREQERGVAATRNAAVLSFMQKQNITGQSIPMPSIAALPIMLMPPPPPSSWTHATHIAHKATPPPPWQRTTSTQPQQSPASATLQPPCSAGIVMAAAQTPHHSGSGGGGGAASSSSLWSKAEMDALIQLRSNLDMRRKGFWEEISAGMRWMGYNRSSKRCRVKWGNMNTYFKKAKESNKNKKRPSYFPQLEALYRKKAALQPQTMPPVAKKNRSVFSEAGDRAAANKVIKLESNVHSRVATQRWYPAPIAADVNPEHVQEIGLKLDGGAAESNGRHC